MGCADRPWQRIAGAIDLGGGCLDTIGHRFLEFARRHGTPSNREGPIRLVMPRRGDTFSLRDGPIPLHSDSSYYPDPERWVLLLCIQPAFDGGDSELAWAREIEAALGEHERLLARRCSWTFTGPPSQGAPRHGPAAILGPHGLRWRPDCMTGDAGLQPLMERFARATRRCTWRVRLAPGDVLKIDNHHALHGRSAFRDPSRKLLRIRILEGHGPG